MTLATPSFGKIFGVMSGLSLGTRVSNLKSIALTVLEHLTPKNLAGHLTLTIPSFGKKIKGHVRTVPGNTCVVLDVPIFNAVFGKVANAASESVVIELLKTKCPPTLYYGLEACPVSKKQYKSLNYVLHSTFRKIFKTKSQDIVNECMLMFNCPSAEETIHKRNLKFLNKYATTDNLLCFVCQMSVSLC